MLKSIKSVKFNYDVDDFVVVVVRVTGGNTGRVKRYKDGSLRIAWDDGRMSERLPKHKTQPETFSAWRNLGNLTENEELAFRLKYF
jgi:hypothetical protein